FIVEKVKFLMRGYDSSSHNFHPYMASIFPGEARLDAAMSFSVEQATKTVNLERTLRKASLTEDELRATEAAVSRMASSVLDHDVALSRPVGESKWILALKFELPSGPIVLAALVNSGTFLCAIENSQIQYTYLGSKSNEIVRAPESGTYDYSDSVLRKSLNEGVRKLKSAEGIYQYRDTH